MSKDNYTQGTGTRLQKTTESPISVPPSGLPSQTHEAPTREQIAKLAYQFWEERGRPEGSPDEDWVRAERQLGPTAE